jgi:hypothetical protein
MDGGRACMGGGVGSRFTSDDMTFSVTHAALVIRSDAPLPPEGLEADLRDLGYTLANTRPVWHIDSPIPSMRLEIVYPLRCLHSEHSCHGRRDLRGGCPCGCAGDGGRGECGGHGRESRT